MRYSRIPNLTNPASAGRGIEPTFQLERRAGLIPAHRGEVFRRRHYDNTRGGFHGSPTMRLAWGAQRSLLDDVNPGHDRLDLTAPLSAPLPAPSDHICDPQQRIFASSKVTVFDVGCG